MQKTLFLLFQDKGLVRWWLLWLLVVGLEGMPGAGDLMDLYDFLVGQAKKLWGKKFTDTNIRRDLRKVAVEIGANPDFVMHGISRDLFGVDLWGSLQLGRVAPGIEPVFGQSGDIERRLMQASEQAIGAVWTIPLSMAVALSSDDPNVLRRFEPAMPKFARAASQAWRAANEGGVTDKSGAELLDIDLRKPGDVAKIALIGTGFQLSEVSKERELRWMTIETLRFYEGKKRAIYLKFYEGLRSGNSELVAEARKEMREYNSQVPYPILKITPRDLKGSLKGRMMDKLMKETFGARDKRGLVIQEESERLFVR